MKLHQLRALVTISDCGSIHEASRQLHITQPALSKTIRELEASLSAVLLERQSTGIRLTPSGRRLTDHARLILGSVRQARIDMENMKGTAGGEVAIGVTPLAAGVMPMPDILDAFRRAYPDVRLRLIDMRANQLAEHLRQGTIDMALATQWHAAEPVFKATDLGRIPSVIAGRRDHPLREARSLHDLIDVEWITLDPLSDRASSFSRLFSDNGLPLPSRVMECSVISIASELCLRSDALLVVSGEARRSRMVTDRMTLLSIADPLPEQAISLIRHHRHVLTEPAEQLHEAIRTGFAQVTNA